MIDQDIMEINDALEILKNTRKIYKERYNRAENQEATELEMKFLADLTTALNDLARLELLYGFCLGSEHAKEIRENRRMKNDNSDR